jgi:uncharacterized membrane protein YhaH (DUF805 family)
MSPLSLSPSGRLAPLPFTLAAIAIYVLSFGSQMLLSPPVTAHVGVWAFALAQAVLIWAWYVLHVRRLRDAGRPAGLAAGIAIVYVLEVVLIVAIVWLILSSGMPSGGAREGASILNLFVLLYLITALSGDAGVDPLWWWIVGFLVVMLLPIVIALCFSLWTATRASAPPGAALPGS